MEIHKETLTAINLQLNAVIEFLPDATFAIGIDGKVIAWNRAIEEMTGASKEDMIGQGDYAYAVPFHGERRPHLADLLDKSDGDLEAKFQSVKRKGGILFAETYAPCLVRRQRRLYFRNSGAAVQCAGRRARAPSNPYAILPNKNGRKKH